MINLADLSRYRGELMGAAMLFIMAFHLPLSQHSDFYGLYRMGNIGVDMFLFLSGVGLWYSWTKRPELLNFWAKRAVRIYPIWIIIAALHYLPRCFQAGSGAASWAAFIGDVLFNRTFWTDGDLSFWFVPAILSLYVVAPFYMSLIRRHPVYRWLPVVMLVWCFAVEYVPLLRREFFHLAILWQRLPIFFLGVNMAESIRRKDTIEQQGWWLVIVLFVASAAAAIFLEQTRHGRMPLLVIRLLYIPMTICGMLLLTRLFAVLPAWADRALRFVGGVSLECYLVHEQLILPALKPIHSLNYWLLFLILVAATLPVAWVAAKVLERLMAPIEKKIR